MNIRSGLPRIRIQILLLILILVTFTLRLYRLDSQALRGDEAATVLYAALPLGDLWELSRITDPHPPLYYGLLHPWQSLLGDAVWTMRFAGAMASTLSVTVLFRLTQQTLRRTAIALLATALLAVNPLQVWLAQDVRSYPLFTLLGLLSSWALWNALEDQSPTPHRFAKKYTSWLAYIFLTVASLYVHYYTIFLIAFQGLFVVINIRRFWNQKWLWLASQLIIALLILPGLGLAYNFVGGEAGGGVAVVGLAEILQRTGSALLTGFTIAPVWGFWLSLLMLPVWLAGLVILLRTDRVTGSFWVLFLLIPVLGVIFLAIDRPFFKERFLVQAHPAFMVLLASGFLAVYNVRTPVLGLHIPATVGRLAALTLLLLLVFTNLVTLGHYHFDSAYAKAPPWQLYHDFVADRYLEGDVMLTNFPEAAVSYYSPDGVPFYVVPAERDQSQSIRESQTAQIAAAYDRIWFLPLLREGFDENGDVLNWLDRHADRIDQTFFPVYNLNLYISPTAVEEKMIPQPATFAHGIHLRGFQVWDERGQSQLVEESGPPTLAVRPGDSLSLSLYWEADAPTRIPYTVFVHLIAADGFNRTSQDNPPVWGSYPTSMWQAGEQITDKYTLTLPAGTPPGPHRLRVGWYDPATGERVPELDLKGQPGADYITLDMVVHVE